MSTSAHKNPANVFKVLIATDIHLGYGEKNQLLTDDSFIAFEEILQIANSREVDLILLGGDLFHDPQPSPNSLNKCIQLLRKYVLGDKMIEFEFLSDQNQNFPDSFSQTVNYEDMNLNVSIPVFSIHGNHDDITGTGRLSSMDILSSTGLINYFGKWRDLSEVEISPIVLQKNDTKFAIYGLSHIHDVRLARLFRDRKVKMMKPQIPDEEIFNLMVLHQNRADRGRFNYLPEDKLPGFLDLVVWGHEHDCRIEPEFNPKTTTWITQPGSSVATSLSEGESIEKKVGILEVCEKEFKLIPVKLKTVRPFIFNSINIEDYSEELRLDDRDAKTRIHNFYCKFVDEMIEKSKERVNGHKNQPKLPLIRLRVIYLNEQHIINTARFGQIYEKKVANPESLLVFKKQIKRAKNSGYNPDEEALKTAFSKKEKQDCVEDVVETYFNELEDEKDKLKLFSLASLTEICRLLVTRDDEIAADTIVQKHLDKAQAHLESKMCNEEDIPDLIKDFQENKSKAVLDEALLICSTMSRSTSDTGSKMKNSDDDEDEEEKNFKPPPAKRGRGRGAATTTSRARGKAADLDTSNGLNVKKGRGAATKRASASTSKSIYINSDSD